MPRPPKDDTYKVLGYTLAFLVCVFAVIIHVVMLLSPPDPYAVCYNLTLLPASNCAWGVRHERGPVYDLSPGVKRLTSSRL